MNATALASAASLPVLIAAKEDFSFNGMRIFTSIPDYHYDVAALRGMVIVYDRECLSRDPIKEGNFYVVESQYPVGGMSWEMWLELERGDRTSRAQPSSPLRTRREVVEAVRRDGRWWHRLPSGFHDGPFQEWAVAHQMVGKVVGLYRPD
ncbi:hypothetical protein [Altericroceibacterium xinjiangense]|uniref:hypothetical protein n=1 Tax=Altericroceibacterium xinjiangense TaxID=762261 RepID=UPI000F7F85C7|nr:hypothetical protein [Altericroceibacterium xinjiangense]